MRFGEPFFLSNMMVYPVFEEESVGSFVDLKTSFERGEVDIKDSGEVKMVKLSYNGAEPLYVWEGEGIEGALQDRVFAESFIMVGGEKRRANVFCVEESRWSGGNTFKASYSSYPRLRSLILQGKDNKNQQSAVWWEVSRKQRSLKVSSKTASMHDSYRELSSELERYVAEVEVFPGQTGFFITTNRGFLGMDSFSSPELFLKVWKRLLLSYALDAYEDMVVSERKKINLRENKVLELLGEESLKEGNNVLLKKDFVIKIFIRNGKRLHSAIFPRRS